MSNFFDLNTSLSLLSTIFSLSIILFFFRKANRNGLFYSFLFFQSMIFLWSFASIYHKLLIMNGVYNKMIHILGCHVMENLAYCYTGVAWVIFCMNYVNISIAGRKKIIRFLLLLSALFFITVEIKQSRMVPSIAEIMKQHLFLTLYILSYIVVGIIILLRDIKNKGKFIRKQVIFLILAILIPVFFIIYRIYLIKIGTVYLNYKQFYINVIPIGFTLSSLFISIACFKYQFMNIIPIALNKAVDSMQESILIINLTGVIMKYNHTFQTRFYHYLTNNHTTFEAFMTNLSKDILNKEDLDLTQVLKKKQSVHNFDITINGAPQTFYSVTIEPIMIKNEPVGNIVTFYDITTYKNLFDELKQKYSELEDANSQLIRFTKIMEDLAASNERNRIASDVHDSIGHTLTSIIYLLEVCCITTDTDKELTKQKLNEVLGIARNGLLQIKDSIEGIIVEKASDLTLTEQISQLISGFHFSEIAVKVTIIGEELKNIGSTMKEAVYRVCQEGLTNAIRHGKPEHIDILLKFENTGIKLYIIDDGSGCKEINKDYGLSGMENRIHKVNGVLRYGPGEEKGFFIHVEIPVPPVSTK